MPSFFFLNNWRCPKSFLWIVCVFLHKFVRDMSFSTDYSFTWGAWWSFSALPAAGSWSRFVILNCAKWVAKTMLNDAPYCRIAYSLRVFPGHTIHSGSLSEPIDAQSYSRCQLFLKGQCHFALCDLAVLKWAAVSYAPNPALSVNVLQIAHLLQPNCKSALGRCSP